MSKKKNTSKDAPMCWSCPSCENAIGGSPPAAIVKGENIFETANDFPAMSMRDHARMKQIIRGELPDDAEYRSMAATFVKRKTGLTVDLGKRSVCPDRSARAERMLIPRAYSSGFSVSDIEKSKRLRGPYAIKIPAKKKKKAKRKRKARAPSSQSSSDIPTECTRIEILQANPKKQKSAVRYELYKKAKTVGEYFMLGGSRADFRFDVARGFVSVVQAPSPVVSMETESKAMP